MRTYGDVGEPRLWPLEFESILPPPRQIPEAGSQMIAAPDWSDWNWNGFGPLENGQIRAYSWRPCQVRRRRERKLNQDPADMESIRVSRI